MSLLVKNLLDAYEGMAEANTLVASAIRDGGKLPRFLPTYQGEPKDELATVVRSLTELWHTDDDAELLDAGLLCVTTETIDLVNNLNIARKAFKDAVADIRKGDRKNTTVGILVEQLLGNDKRSEALREAMRTARIGRLDLLKCYRIIRTLPPTLLSISWTWATTHSKIVQVTLEEADTLANALLSDVKLQIAQEKLGNLKPGTPLARRAALDDQLRANLIWKEGKERKRGAITISGIVLFPGEQLPEYIWRERPTSPGNRIKRSDAVIMPTPYIPELNLYLYREAD